jgi:stage II sporulation protein D
MGEWESARMTDRLRDFRTARLQDRKTTKLMLRVRIFIILFIIAGPVVQAQVRIRIFTNQTPESAVFSVNSGTYEINLFDGEKIRVSYDEPVVLSRYNGKLAVKKRNEEGRICDSLVFTGIGDNNTFSLRINGRSPVKQDYSGDLQCFPDLETMLFINKCDIEKYVSGVVMAEGGNGKNLEYFKSQAIIARTYMYKYYNKHIGDKYNVCDDIHCQAFNGLSDDSLLNKAAMETKGLVILDKDSTLIIAAFSSNCGGETSSSEDVWLSGTNYLKRVSDPYCLGSRNATWRKSFALDEWIKYMRKSGDSDSMTNPSILNFAQDARLSDYKSGSFELPLRKIRADLNLRSTFFSVYANGDSIILTGKGYGHGVGLCQEGAMAMAAKGFRYLDIINFYYTGVIITDIKNAVALP